MNKSLRKIIPFIKEYSSNVEKHKDQSVPYNNIGYAVTAKIYYNNNKLKMDRTPFSSTYCFSSLNYGGSLNSEVILLQVQPCRKDLNQEAYYQYLKWVIKESPWKDVFISKNINKIIKNRVIVVDPNQSGELVMGGLQAARDAWENHSNNGRYKQLNFWWEVAKNSSPQFVYAITSNLILINDDIVTFGSKNTNHSPVGYGDYCPTNFCINRMNKPKNVSFNKDSAFSSSNLWNKENDKDLNSMIHELFNNLDKEEISVNPFNKSLSSSYDKNKVIDCLVNEIPNMEKELNAKYT